LGLDLQRLVLPKHLLLGYQRIVKSCGLSINLAVFSVPNILKSLITNLGNLGVLLVSAKREWHFTCSMSEL
jgi:hypothetical protein